MITYLQNNYPAIGSALVQHLWLSLVPVVVGALVALPLGYLAVRRRSLYQPINNVGGIIYSIPSLALFLIIPAVIGVGAISPLNVLVGLSLYTVALLTRTVADALISVQGQTTQAAQALGFRPLRQLLGVELPMAVPVLFAGLRVATVANISLDSVGALIGSGGLGSLFTAGFQLGFVEGLIVGIVLSMLLAGLCDLGLVLLQRRLTPWARAGTRR
jgi:osmoprotectant transport system permease protein